MIPIDYNDPNKMWRHTEYDPYKGMSDEERMKAGCLQGGIYFLAVVVAMLLCSLLFSSCKSVEYVPVIEHKTDTVWRNRTAHDSIYVHDSVSVWQKGDIVTIDRWHTRYKLKEVHDTIYISKTDSVPASYLMEVIKEVPAELTWWQQTRLHMMNGILLLLFMWAVIWILRKKIINFLQ